MRGPSAITHGGRYTYPVRALIVEEIREIHRSYASAARRALAAGVEWLEMDFAHGYLGASFFSPLVNQRTDEYRGSLENRLRFHRQALDAVRAVWPERLPLTMRLGSDDFNENGVQFDDAVWAVGVMDQHGLDVADLSLGMNTDDIKDVPFNEVALMVDRGSRVRREVGIPMGVSWNLGLPARGGGPAERALGARPVAQPPRPVARDQRERIVVRQFARGPHRPMRIGQRRGGRVTC